MLSGIDTGYEERFDFPARAGPPDLSYMLATLPRTGSTYLSHLLWRTGCLGAPLEYLNFEPSGPYGYAAGSPERQREAWRAALHRRTSPNGVFGLKCFPMQLEALVQANPALLSAVLSTLLAPGAPRRVVHLVRRDRAAHAASYARATMTGVWRQEQESADAPPPAYSQAALEAAERSLAFQESAWTDMFRDLGLRPLRLCYEEVTEQPDEAVRKVADYLGVALIPEAAVAVPEIRRQSRGEGGDWAALYARSRNGGGAGS